MGERHTLDYRSYRFRCWLCRFDQLRAVQRVSRLECGCCYSDNLVARHSNYKVIEGFSGNPPDATQQLYEGAASINAQLPKKIDAITTLTKAEYRNNVFTYYYDIEPTAYQSPNWSADRMRQIVKTNACGTFTGSLGTSALQFRYVYNTGGRDNIVIDVGEKDSAHPPVDRNGTHWKLREAGERVLRGGCRPYGFSLWRIGAAVVQVPASVGSCRGSSSKPNLG